MGVFVFVWACVCVLADPWAYGFRGGFDMCGAYRFLWWLLFCGDLCVCVCPWLTHGPTGSVVAVIVCVCPRLTHGPTGSVVAVICVGRVCVCVCVLISGVMATRALACVHVCVHGCVCLRVGVCVCAS
jgi:hypothetical protein